MVGVENLAGVLDVEIVGGPLVPGEVEEPVEVGPDHAVLGGGRGEPLEPAELAVGDPARLLGQRRALDPLPQLVDLGLLLVALAELLLDRAELLAQVVLALALVDPLLDLGLDLGAELDHLELAGEDLGEPAEPDADVDLLEDLLLLGGRNPQRPGDQVGERRGVLDVGDRELQLLRQVGDLLDDLAEGALDVPRQRLQLGALVDDVGQLLDRRHQIGLGPDEAAEPNPLGPLDQDPDRPVRDLQHPGDDAGHPDPLDVLGPGLVELGILGGDHDQAAVAGEHVVDQLDRALLADRERRQRPRVGDHVAKRQHRQGVGEVAAVGDRVLDLLGGDDLDRRAAAHVVLELDRRQRSAPRPLNRRTARSALGAPLRREA